MPNPTVDFSVALSAPVLRRLAEAADGHRTGTEIWLLLDPEDLWTVYAADAANLQTTANAHPECTVYGPFLTPADPHALPKILWIDICCEGFSQPKRVQCEGADAVFFSRSAREKFKYPYYSRMLGPDDAAMIKHQDEEMEAAETQLPMAGVHNGVSDP